MSSKRRLRRRACQGKHPYPDQATANASASALTNTGRRVGWMVAYCCDFCGKWHVGHASKRTKQAAREAARLRRKAA